MAHEIAHVAARHGTRQATRGELINIGTIPLIFMGGWTGYAIRQGMGLAIPMGFLTFTRAFEREADFLGLPVSLQVRLRSHRVCRLLRENSDAREEEARLHGQGLLHHPMTDDRIKTAQVEIDKILVAKPEYLVNTSSSTMSRAG